MIRINESFVEETHKININYSGKYGFASFTLIKGAEFEDTHDYNRQDKWLKNNLVQSKTVDIDFIKLREVLIDGGRINTSKVRDFVSELITSQTDYDVADIEFGDSREQIMVKLKPFSLKHPGYKVLNLMMIINFEWEEIEFYHKELSGKMGSDW